jgi:hypothetical protein
VGLGSGVRQRAQRLATALRSKFAPRREIARLERLAEDAYTAMYDAPRYGVRDCYDDAQSFLSRAIALAERHRLHEEVSRLKRRKDHIYNVYDHQFR